MLPVDHRLTRGDDFRQVIRRGRRHGSDRLVVHLWCPGPSGPSRVGFVVSRAVGNAVIRHRVQRRLRHLCREHLSVLPDGCCLVVRALPPAADASYAELGADLERCLRRAVGSVS